LKLKNNRSSNKNVQEQNAIQDMVREQEHQELYWFTLSQLLHPAFLPTSKEIY